MLTTKRSVGVEPEVNLRIISCTGDEACKCAGSPKDSRQASLDVQNKSTIDSTKKETDRIQ